MSSISLAVACITTTLDAAIDGSSTRSGRHYFSSTSSFPPSGLTPPHMMLFPVLQSGPVLSKELRACGLLTFRWSAVAKLKLMLPPSCIQMRNVILSASPRNMRLPDPSNPNLKIDLLPEISQAPRILSDVDGALKGKFLKTQTRTETPPFLSELKQRLLLPQNEANQVGTRYNVSLINSLILYVGMQAIQQIQTKPPAQQQSIISPPVNDFLVGMD